MSVNLVNGDTLNSDFTAICNAIRAKTGDANTISYSPGNTTAITTAIGSISGGGNDYPELIDGTAVNVVTQATGFKKYLFYGDTTVKTITATNVVTIGDYALRGTSNIESMSLGALSSIGVNGIYGCGKNTSPFDITTNGNCTCGNSAFDSSQGLRKVLGGVKGVANNTSSIFNSCRYMIECWWCGTNIGNYVFSNCVALADLYLTDTTGVVTLSNVNALNNVPRTCKVHVPSSLLTSYQSATTWQDFDLVAIT